MQHGVKKYDTSSDSSVDDPPSLTIDPGRIEGVKKSQSGMLICR